MNQAVKITTGCHPRAKNPNHAILVYSPDIVRCEMISQQLASEGLAAITCTSYFEAENIVHNGSLSAAVIDLTHDIAIELNFQNRMIQNQPETAFFVLTRPNNAPLLEHVQLQNAQHLPEPLEPELLLTCIQSVIRSADDYTAAPGPPAWITAVRHKAAAFVRLTHKLISTTLKMLFSLMIYLITALGGVVVGYLFYCASDLPDTSLLSMYSPYQASQMYSYDNVLLSELYFERRHYLPYSQIPLQVRNAVIAVEDQRYFEHSGIDPLRMLGALYADVKKGGYAQGGSTITQQMAKMIFLSPEKTITRKIKEVLLAIQIESIYSKEEILGHYLNKAYFGPQAYGIVAAADAYFQKTVDQLNLPEAALLAGLLKAPAVYSPFKNPELARQRRDLVLQQMFEVGFITAESYRTATAYPLPTHFNRNDWQAPYFVDFCKQYLDDVIGDRLYTAGLKVYTTLDSRLQRKAEKAIASGIEALDQRSAQNVQAALLAVELATGKIKAMVGGAGFSTSQFNRATQAMRQPGSAFKPVVYLAALTQGYTTETILYDQRTAYSVNNGYQQWRPKNYHHRYYGFVTMETALAKSLNAATLDLAHRIGLSAIIDTAGKLGIQSRIQGYYPSALGASEMTLMELVYAYAVMATGYKTEPVFIDQILDHDQDVLLNTKVHKTRVLDTTQVKNMRTLLAAVVDRGTGRRALQLNRRVYGKTGTSNDNTNALFIGFDDNLVVGVWVGKDDNTPIGKNETGGRAALPIWIDFMTQPTQG